jgi:aspartate/methionine/tyrosine aminotransferase
MPRPPACASEVEAIPGSVYAPVAARGGNAPGPVTPLNVGDTWLEPFEGGRPEDVRQADHPGLNRYSETRGVPALVDALVAKVRSRNGLVCERESLIVTGGATAGLAHVVGSIVAPGEELLILAPFWPLIRGMTQAWKARPVEVPFYDRVDSAEAAVEAVRERLTPRSVALYLCSPSNPAGRVLPADWLEALAELARREGLWLVSDEVYEDYVYRGEHVSIGRFAPERTFSAFSFSKAYGMAGHRTGYLVGPPAAMAQVHKVSTHTFYSAPTASQVAGLRALRDGGAWLERARASYREAGESAARTLGLPPPEGSTFLFVDVSAHLDERGIRGFLADCLDDGVALSPGASSGSAYTDWVRLCYTSAPPEEVAVAVAKLAKRLR